MPNEFIQLPDGTIPVRSLSADEILTGDRNSSFSFTLVKEDGSLVQLDGVTDGQLSWTTASSVHGSGELTIVDVGQDIDWLSDRIQPYITVEGLGTYPLGLFLISEAPENWADTGRTWSVQLLDRCTILDQDAVDETYVLDVGTNIISAVTDLIDSTGEDHGSITPSSKTLAAATTWDPGTTKLRIINDLLNTANYFSLFCDYTGQFIARPYTSPDARPVIYQFTDGDNAIYSPDFTKDRDVWSIPNKYIGVSVGDGTNPGLVSVATNDDPASPYSTVSRGRTITTVETDLQIADQTTLDAYAARRLNELTTPTSSVDITHMFVPNLQINDAVTFRRTDAEIDSSHVVSKLEISTDPTALVTTTLTEVVS